MDPRCLLVTALVVAAALPAQAGVYKWVDENGKVTYTDKPPPRAAGRVEAVEERISVIGMDPAVRAAAERRFAQQALDEERDWQRRQQLAYAQQAAQPAAPAFDTSYSSYYDPYYYGGATYYPRARAVRAHYERAIAKHPPRVTHHSRPRPTPRGAGHQIRF